MRIPHFLLILRPNFEIGNQNGIEMLNQGYILINKYRIERHIASGGFGNIYLATTLSGNVQVAVKEFYIKGVSQDVVNPQDPQDIKIVVPDDKKELFETQKSKFCREAQIQACITNQHVVRVSETFNANNTAYYVMEYVEGQTLAQMIKERGKPFDEQEATSIFVQVADALFAIHAKNIIHLDIKPSNVMIDKNGTAKVLDFGAARLTTDNSNPVTVYTPAYAPMEVRQHRPEEVGIWTDIYSLGATFYYLVTAQRPPQDIDIVNSKAGAFHFTPETSDRTRKLIRWMMMPTRGERPQGVRDVLRFLETGTASVATGDEPTLIDPDAGMRPRESASGGFSTQYVPSGPAPFQPSQRPTYVPPRPMFPSYGNGYRAPQPSRPKKKSHSGMWLFISVMVMLLTAAFFLYKSGVLNGIFGRKEPVEVPKKDPREQARLDSINRENEKRQREFAYFDEYNELLESTEDRINSALSTDSLNAVANDFSDKVIELNTKYDGIEPNESHTNSLNRSIDRLNELFSQKYNTLRESERAALEPTYNEDEVETIEDTDSANTDDDSFLDIDSRAVADTIVGILLDQLFE